MSDTFFLSGGRKITGRYVASCKQRFAKRSNAEVAVALRNLAKQIKDYEGRAVIDVPAIAALNYVDIAARLEAL